MSTRASASSLGMVVARTYSSTSRLLNHPGSPPSMKVNVSSSLSPRAARGWKPCRFAWSSWRKRPGGSRSILIAEFPEYHAAPNSGLHQTSQLQPATREEFRRLSETFPGLQRGEIEGMGINLPFSRVVPSPSSQANGLSNRANGLIVTSVVRQMNRGLSRAVNDHPQIVGLRFGAFRCVSASRLSPPLRGHQPSRSLQFIAHLTVLGR